MSNAPNRRGRPKGSKNKPKASAPRLSLEEGTLQPMPRLAEDAAGGRTGTVVAELARAQREILPTASKESFMA